MAQLLSKSKELTYIKLPFKLPYDQSKITDGFMVGLMIQNTTQANGILSNPLVMHDSKYTRYHKPIRYNDKIFTYQIKMKLSNDEQNEIKRFTHSFNMAYVPRATMIKTKNVIVDTSPVHDAFINHCIGKNYPVICKSYISHLKYYFETTCKEIGHPNRFLIINAADWSVSGTIKNKLGSSTQKLLNPISMICYLLKKNHEVLQEELAGYEIIILDGDYGWFKFNFKDVDDKTILTIVRLFSKFKNNDFDYNSDDAEDDGSVPDETASSGDGYSQDSEDNVSNEEQNELDIAKLEVAKQEIEDSFADVNRSMAKNKRLKLLREHQKTLKIDNMKLSDIDENKIDYNIEVTDLSDKVFTPIESMKKIRYDNFYKSYNSKVRNKDIVNCFKALNDRDLPVVITKIEKKNTSDAMNLKETWYVSMEAEDGSKHSINVDIPIVYDDKYMYLSGNRKEFVNQQILKPLVKIAPDTVQVCSNYNKIFCYRYGETLSPKISLFKKIILAHPELFKVHRGNCTRLNEGKVSSIEFDSLAKEFVEIIIKRNGIGLNFDTTKFDKLIEEKKIDPIKDGYLYCIYDSRPNAKPMAYVCPVSSSEINDNNDYDGPIDVFCEIFKRETGKDFWELAGKEKPGKRFMYSSCTVMGKKIPMIIFLGYFVGISKVLNAAGITHRFTDKNERNIGFDEAVVRFADGYLIYKLDKTENGLLLSALNMYDTRAYNYADWDTKTPYLDIFGSQYGTRILASGLDAYYDNMIDPITKEILSSMNLPTDFIKLMLCANTLLADNQHSSELSLTEFRVRNMEMISAYLYKSIASAYSRYKRTKDNRTPDKISIPKNEVIMELLTSNIVEDVSILNPIMEKDKEHNITCKGPSGINLERAYTQEKRSFDASMTGMMTISTSPDANCGVVRKLTVEPKVINSRGFIDCDQKIQDMDASRLFGYSELANGIGVSMDNSNRTSMAVKQNSHLTPTRDMCPLLISTGIERQLPYSVSKDFVVRAKDDGVIKEYDEKSQIMIASYKDGTFEAINLGANIVKNGAGGFYLSNKMKPYFKVGQKFKKNEILSANKDYFSTQFDGTKLNLGTLTKLAITSSYGTFEDSNIITENLSKRLGTEVVMQKHVILGTNANISQIVDVGDKVTAGDNLITFEQANSEESVNKMLANIGDDLKEEIKSMGRNTLHTKYTGVIEDIKIYTPNEPKDMSPSLAKVVNKYWSRIRDKKKMINKYKITDPTYQGNTFSEVDGPIKVDSAGKIKGYKVEDGVIIEFYIKYIDNVKPGDKITHQLALKGVVCTVMPDSDAAYTPDEPDEPIEAFLSPPSVLARQVVGILPTMFTQKIIVKMKKQLKEMYEKG